MTWKTSWRTTLKEVPYKCELSNGIEILKFLKCCEINGKVGRVETVSVVSNDPPCKDGNAGFTTYGILEHLHLIKNV